MTSLYVKKRKRDDPGYKMHFNLILFNWKVFIFICAYVNFYVAVPGVSLHKSVHDACERALIELELLLQSDKAYQCEHNFLKNFSLITTVTPNDNFLLRNSVNDELKKCSMVVKKNFDCLGVQF